MSNYFGKISTIISNWWNYKFATGKKEESFVGEILEATLLLVGNQCLKLWKIRGSLNWKSCNWLNVWSIYFLWFSVIGDVFVF